MCQSQIENMRTSRTSYNERASRTGQQAPNDIELRNYLISLEVLGIDEAADSETITRAFEEMIDEVRNGDIGANTGGSGEGGQQELDILMRHQLEVDIKAAYQTILDFRQRFDTDKMLREQWMKETGEELAIDI
jgi:hypothetical protein